MKKLSPLVVKETLKIINEPDIKEIIRPEVVMIIQKELIYGMVNFLDEKLAKNSKKTSEEYAPLERKGALAEWNDRTSERAFEIADNIRKDLDLLKEYEEKLRYEDDPRRMERYRIEIERQLESLSCYKKKYEELQREVTGEMPAVMFEITDMLQQIDAKLDTIQRGQKDLLARFNDSELLIISTIVHRLDQTQSVAVRSILDVIEADCVSKSDLQGTLNTVQEVLLEIKKIGSGGYDQQLVSEAEDLLEVVDDPKLEVAHKLKLSVPIIPLILSYETELGLKSGLNLKAAWKGLKARV